ncbi:LacI family DNA-binding transcriptional regulator [Chitinophaga nivalis]|uniref:LacI family transcriptional regulator n=1 Tax=Chitinophaga nivalis TaxID=2991709 RepID=A0ABT3ISD5_9BACT|nr:LacI family DNA-binding transcriptional regulator [Chitinophaga nivalis]MCW3463414.1 LacI family transcriptional regulator [Chitinophaga nivalis]MCW3486896.1 LacI family transcriptional regulator [Chitinophaga nivalis]
MQQKHESTIVDIARALNLSIATVSRALNNHPKISEATKKKVKEQADAVEYRRNTLASGLRGSRSNNIGLIIPRVSMYFHATAITAIQNLLHRHGYNLIIGQSNDAPEMEKELASAMFSSRVAGLMVASTFYTTDYTHFDVFIRNDIPLVFFDRVPVDFYPAQVIRGDDYQGGFMATAHLAEAGCKTIAHLSGPLSCNLYKDRYAGYVAALRQYKLPFKKEWVFFNELTPANATRIAQQLFARRPYPQGVFASNDTSAITILEYARAQGIAVPEALRIVGYSNDPRTAIISPPITTVEQFPGRVGEEAVTALLALLKRGPRKREQILTPVITAVELVKRASA